MFSDELENAINEQIDREFYASHLYLSMSAFCEHENWSGFGSWLRLQSAEETTHGMKLFDFMLDCDKRVVLGGMEQPPDEYESLLAVFEQALRHEVMVSTRINALYDLASQEKAFAVQSHLQWFVLEQVEEEKTARDIVAKLKLIGNDVASLLAYDRELGARTLGA